MFSSHCSCSNFRILLGTLQLTRKTLVSISCPWNAWNNCFLVKREVHTSFSSAKRDFAAFQRVSSWNVMLCTGLLVKQWDFFHKVSIIWRRNASRWAPDTADFLISLLLSPTLPEQLHILRLTSRGGTSSDGQMHVELGKTVRGTFSVTGRQPFQKMIYVQQNYLVAVLNGLLTVPLLKYMV